MSKRRSRSPEGDDGHRRSRQRDYGYSRDQLDDRGSSRDDRDRYASSGRDSRYAVKPPPRLIHLLLTTPNSPCFSALQGSINLGN